MRVLIIDDVFDNRDMYTQFLRAKGIDAISASDGIEGLVLATTAQPDAIVLDLGLPRMDGWEVARRLRADPRTRAICVVAVTGHATKEARDRAMSAGVDGFLLKPVTPMDLFGALQRLLVKTSRDRLD